MKKNRSTRDLELSSNESLFMKKRSNSFFKYPLINNVSSKYLKFYTFHAGFKKKLDDLLIVIFNEASNVVSAYSNISRMNLIMINGVLRKLVAAFDKITM